MNISEELCIFVQCIAQCFDGGGCFLIKMSIEVLLVMVYNYTVIASNYSLPQVRNGKYRILNVSYGVRGLQAQ